MRWRYRIFPSWEALQHSQTLLRMITLCIRMSLQAGGGVTCCQIWRVASGTATHYEHASGRISFTPAEPVRLQFDGDTVQNGVEALAPAGREVTIARVGHEHASLVLAALPVAHQNNRWPNAGLPALANSAWM